MTEGLALFSHICGIFCPPQVDSLRRELNRSARQLQRVRERHHETLQRLEQAQRDKKHLQAALRKVT